MRVPFTKELALKYYADHAIEARRWDLLFEVVLDRKIMEDQERALPHLPDLPLETVGKAFLAGFKTGHAEACAKLAFEHVHRLSRVRRESPLSAARRGFLDRAITLALLPGGDISIQWYLLVLWELVDSGDTRPTSTWTKKVLSKLNATDLKYHPVSIFLSIADVQQLSPFVWCTLILNNCSHIPVCAVLADQGRWREALTLAKKVDDPLKKVEIYGILAKILQNAGKQEQAKRLLTQVRSIAEAVDYPPRRNFLLRRIAEIQASLMLFDDALSVIDRIDDKHETFSHRRAAIESIIEALVAQQQFARAIELSNQHGVGNRCWEQIQDALVAANRFSEALSAHPRWAQSDWRVKRSCITAIAQHQAGDRKGARYTLDKAEQACSNISDPFEQAWLLGRIAESMDCIEDEQKSKELLEEALRIATSYNEHPRLVDGICELALIAMRFGRAEAAKELLRHTRDRLSRVTPSPDPLKERTRNYNLSDIVCAMAECGFLRLAQITARKIKGSLYLRKAHTGICKVLLTKGEVKKILNIANKLKSEEEPDRLLKEIALDVPDVGHWDIISSLEDAFKPEKRSETLAPASYNDIHMHRIPERITLAKQISASDIRDECLKKIGTDQVSLGRCDEALRTLDLIQSQEMKKKLLETICFKQSETNKGSICRNLIERLLTPQAEIADHYQEHDERLTSFAEDITAAGNVPLALQVVRRTKLWVGHVNALTRIVKASEKAQDTALLLREIEVVEERLLSSSKDSATAKCLCSLASAYIGLGRTESARRLAKQAASILAEEGAKANPESLLEELNLAECGIRRRHYLTPPTHDLQQLLFRLMRAEVNAGRLSDARATCELIDCPALVSKGLNLLAVGEWRTGKEETAGTVFKTSLSEAHKVRRTMSHKDQSLSDALYGDVAVKMCDCSFFARAKTIMRKWVADDGRKAEILAKIAMAEKRARKHKTSQRTINEARRLAAIADASSGRPSASWGILQAHIEAGYLVDAQEHATQIADKESSLGALAWATIGSALWRAQECESGLRALEQAIDLILNRVLPSLRSYPAAMVAQECARLGLKDKTRLLSPYIDEDRTRYLLETAEALIETGDRELLGSILLTCADSRNSSSKLCGLLARIFPEQADRVAPAMLSLHVHPTNR